MLEPRLKTLCCRAILSSGELCLRPIDPDLVTEMSKDPCDMKVSLTSPGPRGQHQYSVLKGAGYSTHKQPKKIVVTLPQSLLLAIAHPSCRALQYPSRGLRMLGNREHSCHTLLHTLLRSAPGTSEEPYNIPTLCMKE